MEEIKLEYLAWPEVAEILKKPNAIILPTGSIEQHGPHLPLNTDSSIATYVAEKAARKATDESGIRVLVLPAVCYSDVSLHRKFPGTIGISIDTFQKVLEEILRCLNEQGFKNIIVLNGHVQNTSAIDAAMIKVHNDLPNLGLYGINSMYLAPDAVLPLVKSKHQAKGHACETETSAQMVIQPDLVHLERAVIGTGRFSISSKFVGEDGYNRRMIFFQSRKHGWEEWGVMGDPTMSTREEGEKQLTAAIADLAEIIVQIVKSQE
jgi:creatinine amidohydrolase